MMKKWAVLMLVLVLVSGSLHAMAEKGFETIYGLYTDGQMFGQPWQIYDMAGEETEKVCLAIFLFDPDRDMTEAILIGAGAEGAKKYYTWTAGYGEGAVMMSFLLSRFAELKEVCEEGVDFCISYSYDGGETTVDIDTAEEAENLTAILQRTAEDMENADSLETP